MDAQTFDRLLAAAARRPTRRSTLRLLAGGLLGALLPAHVTRAQRRDSDQDGLFDDDEVNTYGTKPDVADTDGDGFGDGQEICNQNQAPGCNQDQVHTNPLVNENAAPPPVDPPPPLPDPPPPAAVPCGPGLTSCGDYCADLATDHGNCGGCGNRCSQIGPNYNCERGVCIRVCSDYGETCVYGGPRQCCGDMVCIYGGYCVQP
jgi:hypothetical protein